jgi:CDP-4-dehydro-6-deoxyglucose reductase
MSHRVTIQPSGHAFQVQSDETILEGRCAKGLLWPMAAAMGRGTCKGKVMEGGSITATTDSTLTEADKARGMALFCVAGRSRIWSSRLGKSGPPRTSRSKRWPCRVQQMERRAPDVMDWLKLPANERLQFLAGQYIDLLLKDGRHRSYSWPIRRTTTHCWNCTFARWNAATSPATCSAA